MRSIKRRVLATRFSKKPFLHNEDRSAIFTDLIINRSIENLTFFARCFLQADGVVAPIGGHTGYVAVLVALGMFVVDAPLPCNRSPKAQLLDDRCHYKEQITNINLLAIAHVYPGYAIALARVVDFSLCIKVLEGHRVKDLHRLQLAKGVVEVYHIPHADVFRLRG